MKRKEKSTFESPERLNRLVEGTRIVGDLISDSNLRIDGEVTGNVSTSSKVVIGELGKISGNLTCLDADIEGKIEGVLKVEQTLVLREKARITGDIYTSKVQIEEGAVFNGKCKMGKISKSDQVTMGDITPETSVVY